MKNLLIIGQFPEPITGEAICNQHVADLVSSKEINYKCINTSLIENVGDVGKLSLIKFVSAIYITLRAILSLVRFDHVYITPGQSLFGLIRFFPIVFLSTLLGKKLFLHWHGYGIKFLIDKLPHLTRFFFNSSITNIVLTNDLKEILIERYPEAKIKVVENFSGLKASKILKEDQTKLQVLYLGGLMEEKGIYEFIEVARNNNNFEFVVCGRGGEKIEKELIKLNNERVLTYLGSVKGEDKIKAFRDSDIFVLQSNYRTEGVPLTVIEAMSQGCAIVTTKHNGIPETVQDSAIFIEKQSVMALQEALHGLDSDRNYLHRLKAFAVERSKKFSVEKFNNRIVKVLEIKLK